MRRIPNYTRFGSLYRLWVEIITKDNQLIPMSAVILFLLETADVSMQNTAKLNTPHCIKNIICSVRKYSRTQLKKKNIYIQDPY